MPTTERDRLYRAGRTPTTVQVPEMTFLTVTGQGDPNTSVDYADAVQALFAVSYTAHFRLKKALGTAERVGPLEGLWWAPDMRAFEGGRKDDWHWTVMIVQPDEATPELLADAGAEAARRRELPALGRLRVEAFEEGTAAQVLHVGPYDTEGPTIAALHEHIRGLGGTLAGKHHEIYLGDPRRSAPERLRTIVRQPYVVEG
jgi:hypothetical protein